MPPNGIKAAAEIYLFLEGLVDCVVLLTGFYDLCISS